MIAIIDYGAGNIKSVKNALDYIKIENKITSNPDEILEADKIIFPGVGNFSIIRSINQETIKAIKKVIKEKYFLGICLGLQLLFEKSEEAEDVKGLSIFKGDVKKFNKLKVPQIGWNQINIRRESPLLKGIKDNSFFYFVHSYYVCPEEKITLTTTHYGVDFVSSIASDNIFGVQFHPEKSGILGLKLLKNFAQL